MINEHTGLDRRSAVTNFEDLTGRPLTLERTYRFWEDPLITPDDEWSRDQGRTLVLSWTNRLNDWGPFTRWADIASGQQDDLIDQNADALEAFAAPVYLIFDHEPERWIDKEGDVEAGIHDDFIAAYKHIHDRFEAGGVTNVRYVLSLMAYTYTAGNADLYYPGDSYVDVLAADGYNWSGCPNHPGPWRSFQNVFNEFHDYGAAKGKDMFVTEYGSGEDPEQPDRKAQWFTDELATLESWPEITGVLYFNASPEGGCTWWVDSSTEALDSYVAFGADPYMNPPPPWDPPTVTISSGPADPTYDTTATFTFTSLDPAATFTCGLDGSALEPCASPAIYTGLALGPHTFTARATDQEGLSDDATWTWTVQTVGVSVVVSDFLYTPFGVSNDQGQAVLWSFVGPGDHSVRDDSGMGLYDSGVLPAGSSFASAFVGAGSYRYTCAVSPSMFGTVKVPLIAPPTGAVHVALTVTMASEAAPAGHGYDVQVKRPGSSRYVLWKYGVLAPTANFTPPAPGTYRFKARLRDLGMGASSSWSVPVSVVVS
jgi:plastocyanin